MDESHQQAGITEIATACTAFESWVAEIYFNISVLEDQLRSEMELSTDEVLDIKGMIDLNQKHIKRINTVIAKLRESMLIGWEEFITKNSKDFN